MIGPKNITDFTVIFKTDSDEIKEALFKAYPRISYNIQDNVKFNDLAVKLITKGSTSLKYGYIYHIYNDILRLFSMGK